MNQTITILNQVVPVVVLISLGAVLRKTRFLSTETVAELRALTVNTALPAVLFLSFLDLRLERAYAVVFVGMFLLCVLLFAAGKVIAAVTGSKSEYLPFMLTGFEYGMLGISLFGTAYGIDGIGPIAVIALGHEVFIWFLFLPLLLHKRSDRLSMGTTLKAFATSPVIIAIVASLALNLLGARDALYELPLTGALMNAGRILGNLTVPLILIIVGYGISFDLKGVKAALPVVLYRFALLIPAALVINRFFIRDYLGLDRIYETALFSFLILPPPFIIPLYTKPGLDEGEQHRINNTLTLHTLCSIALFIGYFITGP
ncbi:MAG: hypothetical protein JXB03_01895 [Spirochaetales bacterium]|nr:hypothetical protein [Spirochaetales bacterium]